MRSAIADRFLSTGFWCAWPARRCRPRRRQQHASPASTPPSRRLRLSLMMACCDFPCVFMFSHGGLGAHCTTNEMHKTRARGWDFGRTVLKCVCVCVDGGGHVYGERARFGDKDKHEYVGGAVKHSGGLVLTGQRHSGNFPTALEYIEHPPAARVGNSAVNGRVQGRTCGVCVCWLQLVRIKSRACNFSHTHTHTMHLYIFYELFARNICALFPRHA